MNNKFWNEKTKSLTPYVPGEQPKIKCIKLNTNENPYPPSPLVLKALREYSYEELRKYPDPSGTKLKEAISNYYGVGTDWIFLGNGSDEILAFAFQAFFNSDSPIAFPDVTYSFYPVYANINDIPVKRIPVKDDLSISIEDYFDFPGGVVIANPNAPTGGYLEPSEIRKLLSSNPERLVIIDEAYIDFGGESSVCLMDEFENLLVVQTLSKSRSLAGIRVGFAFGSASLVKALEYVRDSFNSYTLDSLSQTLAICAFEDGEWFERTRADIVSTRERFVAKMEALGFVVLPSMSNFIFTTHTKFSANRLYELLREKGILVRYFKDKTVDRFLRITIGTDEEMQELINTISNIFEKEKLI